MTPFLWTYVAAWTAFCGLAAGLAWKKRETLGLRKLAIEGIAFLCVPWKVALFVPAIVFVTFAGKFTDDETWDVISGGGMSVFTFATSWWVVGTAVRVVRRKRPAYELVIALAVMLFSSSWFYDGYLLLRDGAYTQRWLGNLMLSPTIYLCAGLVLNLEPATKKSSVLEFAWNREDWPRPPSSKKATWRIALAALPLILIAGYFLVGFVGWSFQR